MGHRKKIKVGISSCLLGERVRYDGGHKREAYISDTLSRYFELTPFCPEVGIGLGVPRPTLHLVEEGGEVRVRRTGDATCDVTDSLRRYALGNTRQCRDLSAYIFKSRSPSCGLAGVPLWNGEAYTNSGEGTYSAVLRQQFPLLPMAEETILRDADARATFIRQIFVYHRWQQLCREPLSVERLAAFHAGHELILRSHDPRGAEEVEGLLAAANDNEIDFISESYVAKLMKYLQYGVARGDHADLLLYLKGELEEVLASGEKLELSETIDRYSRGELPLAAPVDLLRQFADRLPDAVLRLSFYLNPAPEERALLYEC
jgi:uncharacterized protein YbbK (DUF523 family)/uncharacterized protein YbgA (DUF1722 family)